MAEADRLRADFEFLTVKVRQARQNVADTTFTAVTQVRPPYLDLNSYFNMALWHDAAATHEAKN